MKKVFDCITKEVSVIPLTEYESKQIEDDAIMHREKEMLTTIIPNEIEILKAEMQLITIETLMEVGLI